MAHGTEILILSHQPLLASSLKAILEKRGYAVERLDALPRHVSPEWADRAPGVVLIDAGLLEQAEQRMSQALRDVFPASDLIFFATAVTQAFVVRMLRLGVKGIVLVSEHENALFECIERVLQGGTYLSPDLLRQAVLAGTETEIPHADLTTREKQVLRLIAEGHTTREVARQLNISVKTAVAHRSRIMEKLDIHDTATLVRFAIRTGLLPA
jgi:DNA-binding NarL/FixJ family response regulator